MAASVQIRVDNEWLSSTCRWGSLSYSHTWPGGSDLASWTSIDMPLRLRRPGVAVGLYVGSQIVWGGKLASPDSFGSYGAVGLWRGGQVLALDGAGASSVTPDTAIDAAIARVSTLGWKRPVPVFATAANVDVSQGPVTLASLMDAAAMQTARVWGVLPDGTVIMPTASTVPTYHLLSSPLNQPLGVTNDGYANQLVGRYNTGTAYASVTETDAAAVALIGQTVEAPADLTSFGAISAATARSFLQNLFTLGRSKPAWTQTIPVGPGDIRNPGGVPIARATVTAANTILRLHNLIDSTGLLGGRTFVDVRVGQTQYSGDQLTITPFNAAPVSFTDVLAQALGTA